MIEAGSGARTPSARSVIVSNLLLSERKSHQIIMLRKYFLLISAFVLISLWDVSGVQGNDAVPVLLWGGSSSSASELNSVNPLVKTSRSEFQETLVDKLERSLPPVLVFVKDNLCVEDIIQHKEALQLTISPSTFMYLPAVETPLLVFEDLPFYNQTYEEDVNTISDGQLVIASIMDLDDASNVYKSLRESKPNLIAALTGKSCSYSRSDRIKRDVKADNTTTLIVQTERILLYASEKPWLKLPDAEDYFQLPEPTVTPQDSLSVMLSFSIQNKNDIYKVDLKFQFSENTAGYYSLKVLYRSNVDGNNETVLDPNYDIVLPHNFSYHCSPSLHFQNKTTALKLTDFQVQIDAKQFSDAYDCIGFTSIPIWSGIFVTFLLGLIMIWALTMIMDIRTMDRFDDPKGKTITISAQD